MIKTFTIFHKKISSQLDPSFLSCQYINNVTLIVILCTSSQIEKTSCHCAFVYHLKISNNKNKTIKMKNVLRSKVTEKN